MGYISRIVHISFYASTGLKCVLRSKVRVQVRRVCRGGECHLVLTPEPGDARSPGGGQQGDRDQTETTNSLEIMTTISKILWPGHLHIAQ